MRLLFIKYELRHIHREVIKLMAQGLTGKEIATKLVIAQSTIRNHRFKLREKKKIIILGEIVKNFSKGIT